MTLEDIKEEYARENFYDSWSKKIWHMGTPAEFDFIVNEIAKRYATACIKADRERVADNATLLIEVSSGSGVFKRGQLAFIADDNDHFEVDKQSILNTPIELI